MHPFERLRAAVDEMTREVSETGLNVLALVLSPFPRRYWGRAQGSGILISCLLQIALCGTSLYTSISHFSHRLSQEIADTTIEAAMESEATRVEAAPAMAFGALTPFAYLTVSATGRWLTYGLLSGLLRAVAYATGNPCGDPVLTFVDDVAWDLGRWGAKTVRRIVFSFTSFWNR